MKTLILLLLLIIILGCKNTEVKNENIKQIEIFYFV